MGKTAKLTDDYNPVGEVREQKYEQSTTEERMINSTCYRQKILCLQREI